jgi:hypothetical protein
MREEREGRREEREERREEKEKGGGMGNEG